MNTRNVNIWDDAQLRAAASRERARAMLELRVRFTDWLRGVLAGGAPRSRECLDCGA